MTGKTALLSGAIALGLLTTVNAGHSDPSQAPGICGALGSEGVLVAHEDCNRFYKCAGGKPVALDCPNGLLWNSDKDYCDWPANVKCGESPPDEPGPPGDPDPPGNPSEAERICAKPGSNDVLVPHEDCDKFYKCAWGLPVAIDCPDGLLYNPDKQYCDWPQNVKCGDSNPPENPSEAERICAEEGSNDKLVPHEDCDKFYKCAWGLPVAIDCPDGLLYNPDEQYCDWPQNVKCGDSNSPDNPSEAERICAEEGSNDKLVPHEDCDKFYKCAWGRPVAIDCPDGLLYNPDKQYCDWPQNVKCGDSNPPDNPSEAERICAEEGSNDKLVPHEDCDKFYKCAWGLPVAIDCPDGLLYNPDKQYCDWPQNVKCGDSNPPDNPSEAERICAEEGSNDKLVSHEECDKFYKCAWGLPVAIDCPDGLLYNPDKQYCDWPQNVKCGDSNPPHNPSEAERICAEEGSHDKLVPHEDCDKFYKCAWGRPVAIDCPDGLLYNPDKQYCDWPQNVKCGDSNPPENPSEAERICAEEGSNDKLVPHEDCDKFYKCAWGLPVAIDCPDGLLYNPDEQYCDWPQNVKCGDSNSPDNPSEAERICAEEGSNDKLVPHEDCDKFYKCAWGRPVAIDCPDGLLYNPDKQYCDWPQNVKCGDSNPPDNPSEPERICAEEGSNDKLVPHEECDKFYKCAWGLPVAIDCPDGLLYNPDKQYCDWPQNVKCGDGNPPDNPSEAERICAEEGSNDKLVPHEDCDKFYKCAWGLPVAIDCPDGLLYNPDKQYCDWPQNVKCGDSNPPDNPSEAERICAEEGSNDKLVPHEDCDKFYKCAWGLPVAIDCPDGLLYNPDKQYCDWPQNVKCGDSNPPDNPSEAERICAEEGSNDKLVPHEDCDKFYKCAWGLPVAIDCPSGLLYNSDKQYCDWPQNVKCGESSPPDNPSEAERICAEPGSSDKLVPHEDCDKFYKCAWGLPVAIVCPDGLLYNPDKQYCDWPNNVNCGGGNPGPSNPSEAEKFCAKEDSNDKLVAHERCNRFYVCFWGRPIAMNCPPGLFFNPDENFCDWSNNVQCSN